MGNTWSVVRQLTHPDLLTWISENLILVGIVAICIWLLYWKATRVEKPKASKVPAKDTIYNEHTWPDGMELDEYYRRKKNGEFGN